MKATQRLYLTFDRKTVVPAGHPKAATLYCVPGDEIPQSACDRFKLVDGGLKGGTKEDKRGGNKEDTGGDDKGGGGGSSQPKPDDLTKVAGVGPKTADALGKAGFTSFAAIGAIEAGSLPAIDGLPAVFKWDAVIASAAQLAAASAQG